MQINKLELHNFRNYHKQTIAFGKYVNFFIGDNGSGKTNLLEAIYFLSLAKSYKTIESNLIRHQHSFARLVCEATINEKTKTMKMILSDQGKQTVIDDRDIKRLSDYIGTIKVLSFLPEDLKIIKGSPRERRFFIDLMYSQMDRQYLNELSHYRILLKQRNELLKTLSEQKQKDLTLLDVVTEQLADSADLIVNFRRNFVKKINLFLSEMYTFLTDQKQRFEFRYLPSVSERFTEVLVSKYQQDMYSKTTNFGPHRDDYEFIVGSFNAKDTASQGEQRMMVLALMLSMGHMIYERFNERPIFLLDDVFSELDAGRQNTLIKYLNQLKAQTIITTTHIDQIDPDILKQSKRFIVKNNQIEEDTQHGRVQ